MVGELLIILPIQELQSPYDRPGCPNLAFGRLVLFAEGKQYLQPHFDRNYDLLESRKDMMPSLYEAGEYIWQLGEEHSQKAGVLVAQNVKSAKRQAAETAKQVHGAGASALGAAKHGIRKVTEKVTFRGTSGPNDADIEGVEMM